MGSRGRGADEYVRAGTLERRQGADRSSVGNGKPV